MPKNRNSDGARKAALTSQRDARSNIKMKRRHRMRLPGWTARRERIRDVLYELVRRELRRNALRQQPYSLTQVKLIAVAQLQALQAAFVDFGRVWAAYGMTSWAPKRKYLAREAELAAALAQPEMRALATYMLAEPGGRPAQRGLLWGVLVTASATKGSKDLDEIVAALQDAGRRRRWALGDLRGPELSGVYDTLLSLTARRDPRCAWHANVAMLRRFACLRDARGRLLHPGFMEMLGGDGSTIAGHLLQRPYKNAHHRRAVNGHKRARARFLVYVTALGQISKKLAGYKLVLLIELGTGLPVLGRLYESTYDERRALLELLGELRFIWPEAPVRWLICDALMDRSKRFVLKAYECHGVHAVAEAYPHYSKKHPYEEFKGVPHCKHADGYDADGDPKYTFIEMIREKPRFWFDTKWRLATGQPLCAPLSDLVDERGRPCANNAYWTWRCPVCRQPPPAEHREALKFANDPRLNAYFPRAGTSKHHAHRQAMLLARNRQESAFHSLKNLGIGAGAHQKVKWGGDLEMEWLVAIACCFLTARRLAHESGDYQRAYEDGIDRGLYRRPKSVRGTQSPKPCRTDAVEPGYYRPRAADGTVDAAEDRQWVDQHARVAPVIGACSLLSFRKYELVMAVQAEGGPPAEDGDEYGTVDDDESVPAMLARLALGPGVYMAQESQRIVAWDGSELEEFGDFEPPLLMDREWDADEVSPVQAEEPPIGNASSEDQLVRGDLDIDDYVKKHFADVDVEDLLSRYNFAPEKPVADGAQSSGRAAALEAQVAPADLDPHALDEAPEDRDIGNIDDAAELDDLDADEIEDPADTDETPGESAAGTGR